MFDRLIANATAPMMRVLSAVVFSLCILDCAFTRAIAAPQASLTFEDIINGLKFIDQAFDPAKNSYRIRFRQEQHSLDANGKELLEQFSWVENDYARKGKLLYTHLTVKLPSEARPYQEWISWDGEVCEYRRADGISVFPDVLPQGYNYYRYTDGIYADCYRLISWKTPSRLRQMGGTPSAGNVFLLPRILIENRNEYQLQREQELVDGAWCHVLQWPGQDKIWIDTSHGYLPRKRKIWFNESAPAGEQFNQDVFEARPGLWLPRAQIEHRYFHLHSPAHLVGKLKRISNTKLEAISFQPLDDTLFRVPLKESEQLLVNDNVRKIQYWRYPKGSDPVAMAAASAMRVDNPQQHTRRHWLLLNGIVIGLLTLVWTLRAARASRS